jgi:uncharacterized protein YfcZ (UPF0381/DUF406 family)
MTKVAQGGENMTLDEQWVSEMAKLFRDRDHARQMLDRWTKKVEEAEAAIIALKVQQDNPPEATEPTPEPTEPAPVA